MAAPAAEPATPRSKTRLAGSLVLVLASAVVVLLASARRGAIPDEPPAASVDAGTPSAPSAEAVASAESASTPRGDADDEASCAIPDRGSGLFVDGWTKLPVGRMAVPEPRPSDSYDVLLHLHGGDPARRIVAPLMRADLVMVAVDAGVGSTPYAEALAGPEPLQQIIAAVSAALAPSRMRHLVVSSWSAGYGGVREILSHHPSVPNAVVLLDSVHASYEPDGTTLVSAGLEPFLSYATRASQREAIMLLTHSEIRPPGYAATSEVASWLIASLDGRRRYGGLLREHGVELKTRFDDGQLSIRGYTGRGKEAHCAQLALLGDILTRDVFAKLGP
jgi:hypothetical protein